MIMIITQLWSTEYRLDQTDSHKVGWNLFANIVMFRMNKIIRSYVPDEISSSIFEKLLNQRFDHAKYGLKPRHRFFSQVLLLVLIHFCCISSKSYLEIIKLGIS